MRILTFTTLYPSAVRPRHGIFIETRLRQLMASRQIEAKVVAPVPWFPSRSPRFGEYAVHAATPREEQRHGFEILHPRYPVIPKVGMSLAPLLLARAVAPALERLAAAWPFDLIDAHYFYPDGVAAVMLGRRLGKPVVVTARGSDVNLLSQYRLPRMMIQWTARHAAGVATVSRALKEKLVELGTPASHIEVLRNGVDLRVFRPNDRAEARRRLGYVRPTLLSVGHLEAHKGHDLVIRALPQVPDFDLVIVGSGPDRASLEALATRYGLAGRVRFAGLLAQDALVDHYGAADALVLASSREGWANVLLESLACGTPVVASDVGGTPEVIAAPEAGVLMEERTPEALARAVRRLFASAPDRSATRRYAEQFSWDATTAGQLRLFRRVIAAPSGAGEQPMKPYEPQKHTESRP